MKEQCDGGSGVWLSRDLTCPNPEITHFTPKSGPWEGGTNVTITGINLGKTFDVRNYFYVQSIAASCKILNDSTGVIPNRTSMVV